MGVDNEYSMSCMPQALQVCSFTPATPCLILDIDNHFENTGKYKGCVMILHD